MICIPAMLMKPVFLAVCCDLFLIGSEKKFNCQFILYWVLEVHNTCSIVQMHEVMAIRIKTFSYFTFNRSAISTLLATREPYNPYHHCNIGAFFIYFWNCVRNSAIIFGAHTVRLHLSHLLLLVCNIHSVVSYTFNNPTVR